MKLLKLKNLRYFLTSFTLMAACTPKPQVIKSKPPMSTNRDSTSILVRDTVSKPTSKNEEYQQHKIDSIKKNKTKPKNPRKNKND